MAANETKEQSVTEGQITLALLEMAKEFGEIVSLTEASQAARRVFGYAVKQNTENLKAMNDEGVYLVQLIHMLSGGGR